MRILLIGEFSRLHNSLKEGLVALGHEVTLVSAGDDFKGFPSDLSIAPVTCRGSRFLSFLGKILRKGTGYDLEAWEKGLRFRRLLPQLKGYDVVQLINSDALETLPFLSKRLYQSLFSQNGKRFLLVCGDETPVVTYWLSHPDFFSPLTAYLRNRDYGQYFRYTLKYAAPTYRSLYDYIASQCDGILSSDLDYHLPLNHSGIVNTFVPNPVNTDLIPFSPPPLADKIVIFHGVNRYTSIKKGSRFFEEALAEIEARYGGRVSVVRTDSLPYKEFDRLRKQAHILLDQVYGVDQGYNALEAMARGQVVFTCAGAAFRSHYGLTDEVAVEARPDVAYLVERLSRFIEDPETIVETGKRARAFIEKEHHYHTIAQRYLDVWKQS
ncbi:MAG TPA: glycosyltransferase [Flavobacterium sp.]|nr:glycosyltransferase [Flavobacterium sp.]